MNKKKAIVTGIMGQDGIYLRRLLLKNDYSVIGIGSKSTKNNIFSDENITLLDCDITQYKNVKDIIVNYSPDVVFNLAGYSNVFEPWKDYKTVLDLTAKIPENFICAISSHSPHTRFCQASSCLVFGKTDTTVQTEQTKRDPLYPYGIAKNYVDELICDQRKNCNAHFTSAIFYNHESPYRGEHFFTKKIINFAKTFNKSKILYLNNLNVQKDIGFAGEYVEAMYKIATADVPDDYIVSTNNLVCLKEIIDYICELSKNNLWDYINVDTTKGNNVILRGDNSKIKKELNWYPTYNWKQIIKIMWENNDCFL